MQTAVNTPQESAITVTFFIEYGQIFNLIVTGQPYRYFIFSGTVWSDRNYRRVDMQPAALLYHFDRRAADFGRDKNF